MYLFSITRFGQRFGIDTSVPDFVDAIQEAARAATADLASRLRFRNFDLYTARRDFFRVDRMFDQHNQANRQFVLSRGFVTPASVVAYYAASPVYLRNNDTDLLTDITDVNEDGQSNHLIVDAERGVVTTYGLELMHQWVMVTYDGGLDVATDDEFDSVPDWLAETAMAQAALYLSKNRQFKPEEGEDLTELKNTVDRAFRSYARYYPGGLKPTASEPTA